MSDMVTVLVSTPIENWMEPLSVDAVELASCEGDERILVRTRYSTYEVIVLEGRLGDVLIRGGQLFPEFRRARVAGSSGCGSALREKAIDVGLHIELRAEGKCFRTSVVEAISRNPSALSTSV
jgi:hypothetical protein